LRDLKPLLEQVAQGEEVILCEQDKAFAKLVPLKSRERWLADMAEFRGSLQVSGEALSSTIVKGRQGDRAVSTHGTNGGHHAFILERKGWEAIASHQESAVVSV
jgi:antitoxin (DNA-binding transcriptional repressor) of toxin-antitoxin stability system